MEEIDKDVMQLRRWYPQTLFPAFWVLLIVGAMPYVFDGKRPSAAHGERQETQMLPSASVDKSKDIALMTSRPPRSFSELINDPKYRKTKIAYQVQRLSDQNVLAQKNAQQPQTLLRAADLVIAASAMSILKPEYRFRTRYLIDGRLRGGTLWGNLVVKGYGDPTIDNIRLGRIANSLYLSGIEKITGALIFDHFYFQTGEYTAGEAPETKTSLYLDAEAAPPPTNQSATKGIVPLKTAPAETEHSHVFHASGLSFNHNLARVNLHAEPLLDEAQVRISPDVGYVHLSGAVETRAFPRNIVSFPTYAPDGIHVQVSGAIKKDGPSHVILLKIKRPELYFGKAFYKAMVARGVDVRQKLLFKEATGTLHRFINDYSPPIHEIAQHLLFTGIPEERFHVRQTLLHHMAVETMGSATTQSAGVLAVLNFLQDEVNIPATVSLLPPEQRLIRRARLSPGQLVKLLQYMAGEFESSAEFLSLVRNPNYSRIHELRNFPPQLERFSRIFTDEDREQSVMAGYLSQPHDASLAFALFIKNEDLSPQETWELQRSFLEMLTTYSPSKAQTQ